MSNIPDFERIVDEAAKQVADETGLRITPAARRVLVDRAIAHQADVANAMIEQSLSEHDLIIAAANQLRESVPYQRRGPRPSDSEGESHIANFVSGFEDGPTLGIIDDNAVERGMARKCWFVPWC